MMLEEQRRVLTVQIHFTDAMCRQLFQTRNAELIGLTLVLLPAVVEALCWDSGTLSLKIQIFNLTQRIKL